MILGKFLDMKVKMQTVGQFLTNCYIVWCDKTKKALVIDPGFDRSKEADEVLLRFG